MVYFGHISDIDAHTCEQVWTLMYARHTLKCTILTFFVRFVYFTYRASCKILTKYVFCKARLKNKIKPFQTRPRCCEHPKEYDWRFER